MAEAPQLTARQIRYRREQQRRKARMRFFAMSFVAILILAGIITAIIEPRDKTTPGTATSTSTAQSGGQVGDTPLPPAEVTGTLGPARQEEITYKVPTAAMLTLPANGRVDMDYFSDAIFIGDSLTQGFQVYASGISNAHYAAYVGVGPKQIMEGTVTNLDGQSVAAIDEILAASPKKVYLLLGTNTLSNLEDEAYLKYYADLMTFLESKLPADTIYYVQAMPPVTAEKQERDEKYANSRIQALNEQLARLAFEHDWNFINLYSALADEAGNLRAEIVEGSDGVHLNGSGYEMWKEYLVTHTLYHAASPYIAGSPYLR